MVYCQEPALSWAMSTLLFFDFVQRFWLTWECWLWLWRLSDHDRDLSRFLRLLYFSCVSACASIKGHIMHIYIHRCVCVCVHKFRASSALVIRGFIQHVRPLSTGAYFFWCWKRNCNCWGSTGDRLKDGGIALVPRLDKNVQMLAGGSFVHWTHLDLQNIDRGETFSHTEIANATMPLKNQELQLWHVPLTLGWMFGGYNLHDHLLALEAP